MRNELVPKEIKVHPFDRGSTLRAAKKLTVEIARGLQIVHRDGEMEWLQHQAPLLSRRGSND